MPKQYLLYVLLCLTIYSCQTDDDLPSDSVSVAEPENTMSVNAKMNHWAYNMMKHHYLFNDEMPVSSALDFEAEFDVFFESMRSSKDRFSYYINNENYNGNVVAIVPTVSSDQGGIYDYIGTRSSVLGSTVQIVKTIYMEDRRIGYIKYAGFDDTKDLREAFTKLKESNVTDLVVDLRNNGGGYVNTAMFLCSLIMPKEFYGMDAQYLKYNDIVTDELFQKEGKKWETYTFYDNDKFKEYALDLDTVYFLVNGKTASASESTINSLRPYMDVVTIGQTTCGKGTGMYNIADKNYRYTLVPLTFRYYNVEWESVPDTGIVPDYLMPESNDRIIYGDIEEPYLYKAISLIIQGQNVE